MRGPPVRFKRGRACAREPPGRDKRRKVDPLAQKMDTQASKFVEVKVLLQSTSTPPAGAMTGQLKPSLDIPPLILSPAYKNFEADILPTRASENLVMDHEAKGTDVDYYFSSRPLACELKLPRQL